MGRLETRVGSINCEIIIDKNVKEGTVISNHNERFLEFYMRKKVPPKCSFVEYMQNRTFGKMISFPLVGRC